MPSWKSRSIRLSCAKQFVVYSAIQLKKGCREGSRASTAPFPDFAFEKTLSNTPSIPVKHCQPIDSGMSSMRFWPGNRQQNNVYVFSPDESRRRGEWPSPSDF
jgi:hypothetical protein